MTKKRIILVLAVLVLIVAAAVAAPLLRGNAEAALAVRQSIDTVKHNAGGPCGTPDVLAHERLSKIGKPAVPYLIASLVTSNSPLVDSFIAGNLSAICCDTFESAPHAALVTRAQWWWTTHCLKSEQSWILGAIASGDSVRISRARNRSDRLSGAWTRLRLERLMGSGDKEVVETSAGILWRNYQSGKVLDYLRRPFPNGSKKQKFDALNFCGGQKITALSPLIAEVLRTETDYQVISHALDAATTMGGPDCAAEIEKMDAKDSPDLPMVQVIEAMAALKGRAYGDRVLYHIRSEDAGKRMAAALVICDCVPPAKAITPLLAALDDSDINVRIKACDSLGRAASDQSARSRLGEVVPRLIDLLRTGGNSSGGYEADRALRGICQMQFGYERPPGMEGHGLGGAALSERMLPIWEAWWNVQGKVVLAGGKGNE